MTRLRILTGRHVGAYLDLTSGTHLIGTGSECDIAISDWTAAPMELLVSDEAVAYQWRLPAPANDSKGGRARGPSITALQPFEPRDFNGVVLCTGPTQGQWPSDVKLLAIAFAPAPKRWARSAWRHRSHRFVQCGAAAIAAMTAAIIAWPLRAPASLPPALPTVEAARAQVQRALSEVAGGRLFATVEHRTIYVSGMAEDAREAAASRAALNAHRGPHPAVPRFAVATDIMEVIRSTVGLVNSTVRHDGEGVFNVTADVTDELAARSALDRMAADLAPAVKKIVARFEKIHPSNPLGPILSQSQQAGLSVVQTRDGVKHVVIQSPLSPAVQPTPAKPLSTQVKPAQAPVLITAKSTSRKE
jgi:type III secretion protein D